MTKMPSLNRRGFTLIEMMVVIAIIGILAGLLFPAIGKALESAKRNKAGVEARAIAAAIDLFFNDHGYLPVPLNAQGLTPVQGTDWNNAPENSAPFTDEESRRIIQVLIAEPQNFNANHQLNTRRKVYLNMETANSTGEMLDPWGRQYLIKLDRDFDGRIEFFSQPDAFRTRSIVVSRGRSGEVGDNRNTPEFRDNVANVNLR